MSSAFLRDLLHRFIGVCVSARHTDATQAIKSNRILAVLLFTAVISLASCGGGGSGSNNNASLSESLVPITVSIDETLPAKVTDSIDSIISPAGKLTSGYQVNVSTDGAGDESIVLAIDVDKNIRLASLVNDQTLANVSILSLSVDSTATALVRLAVGQLPDGIRADQMNKIIQGSADYANLVTLIEQALSNDVSPAANPDVLSSVALITTEIAPVVTDTINKNKSSLTAALSLCPDPADPCDIGAGSPIPHISGDPLTLPYYIVQDDASVLIGSSSQPSLRNPILTNQMPIPWHVALNDSSNLGLPYSEFLLYRNTSPINLPYKTAGFTVIVEQNLDTQREIVTSILSNYVGTVLSYFPVRCSVGQIESLVRNAVNSTYGNNTLSYFEMKSYIEAMIKSSGISNMIGTCVSEASLQESMSTYLAIIDKYILTLSTAGYSGEPSTVAAIVRYAGTYWGDYNAVGVCLDSSRLITNCARVLKFDPDQLYVGIGVDVLRKTILSAIDDYGKPTALSPDIQYSSGVNNSANPGGPINSGINVDQAARTAITVYEGSSAVDAFDPATGANDKLNVEIVDPGIVEPFTIKLAMGETTNFRITDGNTHDIIVSPDVEPLINNPIIASIPDKTMKVVKGHQPGTTELFLYNTKTNKFSNNAKIVVSAPKNLLVSQWTCFQNGAKTMSIWNGGDRLTDPNPTCDPGIWDHDISPTRSPDGSKVAFIRNRYRTDPTLDGADIYIVDWTGKNLQMLLPDSGASWIRWSPTSDKIVYQSGTDIHLVDSNGLNDQIIGNGNLPSWSPDGKRIIYSEKISDASGSGSSYTPATFDLIEINLDGSKYRNILIGETLLPGAVWSPDGSMIAYVKNNETNNLDIYVCDSDGNNERQLHVGSASFLTFSPEGSIVFESGVGTLGVVNPNGGSANNFGQGFYPFYIL